MTPAVKPIGDQIAIRPVYQERGTSASADLRVSSGGVMLPDIADDEPIEGIVEALGDGFIEDCPTCHPAGRKVQFEVKVGDRVLYPLWKAVSINIEGEDFHLLSERDIAGVYAEAV